MLCVVMASMWTGVLAATRTASTPTPTASRSTRTTSRPLSTGVAPPLNNALCMAEFCAEICLLKYCLQIYCPGIQPSCCNWPLSADRDLSRSLWSAKDQATVVLVFLSCSAALHSRPKNCSCTEGSSGAGLELEKNSMRPHPFSDRAVKVPRSAHEVAGLQQRYV